MTRFLLPEIADLRQLGGPHELAITVYVETVPGPDQRENAVLTAKSAIDRAMRTVRERGVSHAAEQSLRARWAEIAESDVWVQLSSSLAIFIAEDLHKVYVLPNALANHDQVGAYFDLGPLVRAVTTPQEAFALTLSAGGWNLWRATADARAEELTLVGDYPADVADATNRATVRDRDHVRRLVGDEGKKLLLETYAKRVAQAVDSELGHLDPTSSRPLFLFATEPMLSLFRSLDHRFDVIAVPGAPDELRPDEIDHAIRGLLSGVNAARNNALVEKIGDGVASGLVATDVVDIGRAAISGAVSTLVYNFTGSTKGLLDDNTGQVTFDEDGYDLLSRLAIAVLDKGGDVIAVRSDEISAEIWNGTAVAGLRFALT
ncbi:MAG: hypothetical protein WBB07_18560 [Mycobacterium sp.]